MAHRGLPGMREFWAWTLCVEIATILVYFGLSPASPTIKDAYGYQWLNLALGYAIGVFAMRRFWWDRRHGDGSPDPSREPDA